MSRDNSTKSANQNNKPKTMIGKLWGLIWKIIGMLLLSLFMSLVIEWVGIAFWWPEEGWQHSKDMLYDELNWLDDGFKHSLITSSPGQTANTMIEFMFEWIFIKTGLIELSENAKFAAGAGGASSYVASAYLIGENFILSTAFVVMTFAVRLFILLLSIPLFIMAIITALIDGLMRRDIRKFGAGRESSFIYHRAKMMIVPLLAAPWVIYLAAPIAINPQLVLIPCAITLGIAITVTISTFKKYL